MIQKGHNIGFNIFIALFIIGFIVLVSQLDKMNCMIATYNLNFNKTEITQSDSIIYLKKYDVSNTNYKLSLVELGGKGCKPCKKMEAVLSEIKEDYKGDLNLNIVDVTKVDDRKIASYFGIRFIPVQIILDRKGKELYRHSGFISKEELEEEIAKFLK